MVFDKIEHAPLYYGLGRGIETILKYYERYTDSGEPLPDMLALEDDKIYLMGMNYKSGDEECNELEAHKNYVDVMYVVEGEEKFYYKPSGSVEKITAPYDADDDCTMLSMDADVASVHFLKGCFAIFFPQDAHCAAQLWDRPCAVRKFIAKVRLDTL